jgi:RpiB/LacA/LacB family sugar-phosphate isomerase
MIVFIGSDHRGYKLKQRILSYLQAQNINTIDVGCDGQNDKDDYNDFAHRAIQAYFNHDDVRKFGILICGTAHGMTMQANRFKGIRAVRCLNVSDAQIARTHNDANFLCLAADDPDTQKEYQDIIDTFFRTATLTDEKYLRRNYKLDIDLTPTIKQNTSSIEILPTLLTNNPNVFRELTQNYHTFTDRIHFDFLDSSLPSTTSTLSLKSLTTLTGFNFDVHLMTNRPEKYYDDIVNINPNLVIFHLTNDTPITEEAKTNLQNIVTMLKLGHNIKVGLAIEKSTSLINIKTLLKSLDHVMLFSGHLGHYGGEADLNLLQKIPQLKKINPFLTIGWDGGVNASNITNIAKSNVNTINVGSAISRAPDSSKSYFDLLNLISGDTNA